MYLYHMEKNEVEEAKKITWATEVHNDVIDKSEEGNEDDKDNHD